MKKIFIFLILVAFIGMGCHIASVKKTDNGYEVGIELTPYDIVALYQKLKVISGRDIKTEDKSKIPIDRCIKLESGKIACIDL